MFRYHTKTKLKLKDFDSYRLFIELRFIEKLLKNLQTNKKIVKLDPKNIEWQKTVSEEYKTLINNQTLPDKTSLIKSVKSSLETLEKEEKLFRSSTVNQFFKKQNYAKPKKSKEIQEVNICVFVT